MNDRSQNIDTKFLILLIGFVILLLPQISFPQNHTNAFDSANKYYQEKEFDKAIILYDSL